MFNFFKKQNQSRGFNLPKPTSQTQEALYLLITIGEPMTRKEFMDNAFIMNAPSCIHKLRKRGVNIDCQMLTRTNKFGREIEFGIYSLVDKIEAEIQYLKMVEKSKKRKGNV